MNVFFYALFCLCIGVATLGNDASDAVAIETEDSLLNYDVEPSADNYSDNEDHLGILEQPAVIARVNTRLSYDETLQNKFVFTHSANQYPRAPPLTV